MIYWILQTLNWFHRTFLTSFYIFMAGGSIAFLMPWKFMINSIRWGLAPSELFLSKWSCLGLCNEILLFLCIEPNLVFSYSQALVSWWEDGSSEWKILTRQTGTNDTDTTGSHSMKSVTKDLRQSGSSNQLVYAIEFGTFFWSLQFMLVHLNPKTGRPWR